MLKGRSAAIHVALLFSVALPASTPQGGGANEAPPPGISTDLLATMGWREVGPFRGGRSAAVAGIASQRNTYYFGGAGGGVWKTEDGGRTWNNVSDGYFGGSIGAVAVAPSDPNVVYVGTGEKTVRGNVSHGDGMWRSRDAGKTWKHIGLSDSRHIPRVRVHPSKPNVVYAAVLGHLFGPNEQRGVYRSEDYGQTWKQIHSVSPEVGCVDLALDPGNPRRMFASYWRVRRTPHSLESGGEGSGLWVSTDGGDEWVEVSSRKGMPKPPLGISGVSVSAADPNTVYAIIEAKDGGVFRSRDGGQSWQRTNQERSLRQRAWYYSRIYADPVDAEVVYVLNVGFHRSKDGGKTFTRLSTPHGDNHDLWIDPGDPTRMIESNDGGANVSYDGGLTWTPQDTQPTAQMYRVSMDSAFPYRLLGGQQDNSALRIRSRGLGRGIGVRDWEPTAGGESGHITAKPDDPDVVYGGSYGGYLTMFNHRTRERRNVHIWPDNPMGAGSGALRDRFQWNFPLQFSRHDDNTLYAASQYLYRTRNGGAGWERISPDLTRNDAAKGKSSGGPITKDNTGVEYYCTIFAVAESAKDAKVLWVGSDDGRVHVTRDGGESWADITPPQLPEWSMINSIDAHPFEPGGAYLAATRYKLDDFRPYLLVTTDWGQSWKTITRGIPEDHFTRVVRADPDRRGLLYAGTERGVYVSADNGQRWQSLQLDLPIVPVTDLAVHQGDLVAATQGRGFWILDDLSPLHRVDPTAGTPLALWQPRPTLRIGGGSGGRGRGKQGANPLGGVPLRFRLAEAPDPKAKVRLRIRQSGSEEPVRVIQGKVAKAEDSGMATTPDLPQSAAARTRRRGSSLSAAKGMNLYRFDLRYESPERVAGMILWTGGRATARCVPGEYVAELTVGELTAETTFELLPDPRSSATQADLVAQRDFLLELRDELNATHRCIRNVRSLRQDLLGLDRRIGKDEKTKALRKRIETVQEQLDTIEEALYQTKNQSRQDPLNFPIRLNDKLSGVMSAAATGDFAPTESMVAVRAELTAAIEEWIQRYEKILATDVPAIERMARESAVPALRLPEPSSDKDPTEDPGEARQQGSGSRPPKGQGAAEPTKKGAVRRSEPTEEALVHWSGVLLDPAGRPVANAPVHVGSVEFAIGTSPSPWQSTRSDANGRFDLRVVLPETGRETLPKANLVVDAPGFTRVALGGKEVGQRGPTFLDTEFGAARYVRLTLNREAILEGRVVSRTGRPVPGATIVIQSLEDDGRPQIEGREVVADARGHYRVHGLSGGTIKVVALGPAGHSGPQQLRCEAGLSTNRILTLDQPSHTVRIELPRAQRGLSGVSLTGPALLPLALRSPTVASEVLVLRGVPAGDYVVRRLERAALRPPASVRFNVRGEPTTIVLAPPRTDPAFPRTGRLDGSESAEAFRDTTILIEERRGWVQAPVRDDGSFRWSSSSIDSGSIRLGLLSPRYVLRGADRDGTLSATTDSLSVPIAERRWLTGRLLDARGTPAGGWTVIAGGIAVSSTNDGGFRIPLAAPVPRGILVRVQDMDGETVSRSQVRGDRLGQSPLAITTPIRTRLVGKVVSPSSEPLAGVQVALYRGRGDDVVAERSPITTDAEGRFCFVELPAGPRVLSLRSAAFLSVVRREVVVGAKGEEMHVAIIADPAR